MKMQIMSDLHLEFEENTKNIPNISREADILLLAGDVVTSPYQYRKFIQFLRTYTTIPIVSVLGNHEYYGNNIKFSHLEYKAALQEIPDMHLLSNSYVTFHDTRIIGSTLWTDYDKEREIYSAIIGMADFRHIEFEENSTEFDLANYIIDCHKKSVSFIKRTLQESRVYKTVVLTHHCPSYNSIHKNFTGSILNGAFTSDLSDLILDESPDIWVSGHVHNNFDYNIGKTRIVHNPYGYPSERKKSGYVDNFVIEI